MLYKITMRGGACITHTLTLLGDGGREEQEHKAGGAVHGGLWWLKGGGLCVCVCVGVRVVMCVAVSRRRVWLSVRCFLHHSIKSQQKKVLRQSQISSATASKVEQMNERQACGQGPLENNTIDHGQTQRPKQSHVVPRPNKRNGQMMERKQKFGRMCVLMGGA